MLSKDEAKQAVETNQTGSTAEACVEYNGLFIVRITHADGSNMDPFFSVDPDTGDVMDFAIMPHLEAITPLFLAEQVPEEVDITDLGHAKVDDILRDLRGD